MRYELISRNMWELKAPTFLLEGMVQEDGMGRAETCMAWSLGRAEKQEGNEGAGAKGQKQQAV